jgi:hypothetical protein
LYEPDDSYVVERRAVVEQALDVGDATPNAVDVEDADLELEDGTVDVGLVADDRRRPTRPSAAPTRATRAPTRRRELGPRTT